MSQTIIDGVIAKTPKGWRKLRPGTWPRKGDRESDHEGGWTVLTDQHARMMRVSKFETIIRRVAR